MRKYADGEEGRGEDEAWWFVQDPNKTDGRRVMEGSSSAERLPPPPPLSEICRNLWSATTQNHPETPEISMQSTGVYIVTAKQAKNAT
jgi:hypothetical protein